MFFTRFLKYKYCLLFLTPFAIELTSIAAEFTKTEDSSYLEYKNEYIIHQQVKVGFHTQLLINV